MPQDIPVEASETLAFTPDSLREIDDAPCFVLRATTTRDKRFHRRLHMEQGVRHHGSDAIRAEVLAGLKALWSPESYAEHAPTIEAYWEATDQFADEKAKDDALEWIYDSDVEQGVRDLTERVTQAWPPLRRTLADNADFSEMSFPLMVAIAVKSWKNLAAPFVRDSGYLTVECAAGIAEALAAFEKANGLPEGVAWTELAVASTNRMYLTEDAGKNSESPSPAGTPPEVSTTALPDPGPSPESTPPPAKRSNSAKTPQGA